MVCTRSVKANSGLQGPRFTMKELNHNLNASLDALPRSPLRSCKINFLSKTEMGFFFHPDAGCDVMGELSDPYTTSLTNESRGGSEVIWDAQGRVVNCHGEPYGLWTTSTLPNSLANPLI